MITDLYQLGRRYAPDERDTRYPVAAAGSPPLLAALRAAALPWRYWARGPVLDQGQVPQCVAYAWKQYLQSSPFRQARGMNPAFVYQEAQQRDEWPGEDYGGTSVRAGAKVLQEMGYLDAYLWAADAEEVKTWLLQRGPVVIGSAWLSGMFTPDADGFLHLTGEIVGGHAYLIRGYTGIRNAFRCVNSWGEAWGQQGEFWLSYADLNWLITQNGEACVAAERQV